MRCLVLGPRLLGIAAPDGRRALGRVDPRMNPWTVLE